MSNSRLPLPPDSKIAALPVDGGSEFNRLIFATSPYLRQHARNPVDWYPWGPEAWEKAARENKPVFLSVGYSACHWCHVMEHESFENPMVSALMNEWFVAIKVDREERPDLDAIHMQVTQALTGRGGWPNSVFLDGRQRPFYAGTYWRPHDFMQLLRQIAGLWREERPRIDEQAAEMARMLGNLQRLQVDAPSDPVGPGCWQGLIEDLYQTYDPDQGGFGGAPKFPPHSSLLSLLSQPAQGDTDGMLRRTLDAMGLGGIHDHAGGGFHRYATDDRWFLPHFEKMLYDNGQLAEIYARAAGRFDHPVYAEVTRGICDWVLREMTDPQGGFHSALDADSEGGEGAFYVWSLNELHAVLGDDAEKVGTWYQATPQGTFHDEATGKPTGSNILCLNAFPPAETRLALSDCLIRLRKHRDIHRSPPALDDKVLTAWNGLMIRGLAIAGRELNEPRYTAAAERAARFLLDHARDDQGRLTRSWRAGRAAHGAVLDDYAFLAHGLLTLGWTDEVRRLMQQLEDHFRDEAGGYYLTPHDGEALITRIRDPFDNATPAGVGIAAQVWAHLGEDGDLQRAREIIDAFRPWVLRAPQACQSLLLAHRMLPDDLSATPTLPRLVCANGVCRFE